MEKHKEINQMIKKCQSNDIYFYNQHGAVHPLRICILEYFETFTGNLRNVSVFIIINT